MKHVYVAIFLVLFQLSPIRAPGNEDDSTTSGDTHGTEKGDQQATSSLARTPAPKSWYTEMPKPKIDEDERKLLDALMTDDTRGTRSTSRSSSRNSDDGSDSDDDMFSLSDEDRNDTENLHDIVITNEKIKEKADNIPRRKKYWPKNLPHIGSMTPYRFLRRTVPDLEYFKPTNERELHRNCTVVRIWNLFRHGTRYPSKETSHGMRTRLRNLKETILLKLYEHPEILSTATGIDIVKFINLLDSWDVVPALSVGLVYVSKETLNRKKTKAELAEELEKLAPLERATREKNKGGADEQIEEAKALTPLGSREMDKMGTRFLVRFKYLLLHAERESLLFKFTDCQRTRESALRVYSAIFGEPAENDETWHEKIDTGDEGKDPLLKYDALCAHWKKNYKKSDLNMHQLDTLITGKYVRNVLTGIANIFKFPKKSITFNDGRLLYESCAFEKAWKLDSPWCELMSEEYLSVYEYLEDYEFYKNDGPDNDMNLGVGCFLFNDMVDRLIGDVEKDEYDNISWNLHLENDGTDRGTIKSSKPGDGFSSKSKTSDIGTPAPERKTGEAGSVEETQQNLGSFEKKSEPKNEKNKKPKKSKRKKKPIKKATFYFTHLTAILKFITHLRVHVDKVRLTPYNFEEMKDRRWRSARIGAFATNISFVLMKCDKSYFILALHQERPLILPNCHHELCPLETFLKTYRDSIFDCDYEEMCEKYKHRFFNRSMSPYKSDTSNADLASLFSRSSSSFGSSRRSSFRSTKEVN